MRKSLVAGGAVAALAALTACSSNGTSGTADAPAKGGYVAVADKSLSQKGDLTVQLDYDSVETTGLDPATAATAPRPS